jgi:hypothetical protein
MDNHETRIKKLRFTWDWQVFGTAYAALLFLDIANHIVPERRPLYQGCRSGTDGASGLEPSDRVRRRTEFIQPPTPDYPTQSQVMMSQRQFFGGVITAGIRDRRNGV